MGYKWQMECFAFEPSPRWILTLLTFWSCPRISSSTRPNTQWGLGLFINLTSTMSSTEILSFHSTWCIFLHVSLKLSKYCSYHISLKWDNISSLEARLSERASLEGGSVSQLEESPALRIMLPDGSAFKKQLGVMHSRSLSDERYVSIRELTALVTSVMTVSSSK